MAALQAQKCLNKQLEAKEQQRNFVKKLLAELSFADKESKSQLCSQAIFEWLSSQSSIHKIAAFYPMNSEISLMPLYEKLWQKNYQLAFPRTKANSEMQFYFANSKDDFEAGQFGIQEPKVQEVCSEQDIDLILVPGLSFDLEGNRLGRGKAYYDHFLSRNKATRMGVCFSDQVSENLLPTEEHDVPMHFVSTDKGVFTGKGI